MQKFILNGFEMAARKPAFWQLDHCPGSLFRTYPTVIRALSSRSVSEKLGLLSRPRQRQLEDNLRQELRLSRGQRIAIGAAADQHKSALQLTVGTRP